MEYSAKYLVKNNEILRYHQKIGIKLNTAYFLYMI